MWDVQPNELYNAYFATSGIWPDLMVFTRHGWRVPYAVTPGVSPHRFNAGHSSFETARVVIAVRGLGYPEGSSCADPARLADVGMTLSTALRLPAFPVGPSGASWTVGKVLACTQPQ